MTHEWSREPSGLGDQPVSVSGDRELVRSARVPATGARGGAVVKRLRPGLIAWLSSTVLLSGHPEQGVGNGMNAMHIFAAAVRDEMTC
jgi:hypothetical protein